VLQLIYPDLDNRFQGEEGFDDCFLQPFLSHEIAQGSPEHDFWTSMDESGTPELQEDTAASMLPPLLN
jgi:hypothetical protein